MTIIIPIILLIITTFIYFYLKIGIEKKNYIQITPPENMNPLELAYIYNGQISKSDIISLIPYLVDKEYIKMEFPVEANNMETCDFQIIKAKDYDGKNIMERYILNKIFAKSNVISYNELFNSYEFVEIFDYCMEFVNSNRNYNIIYEKNLKKIKKICNICMILGFIAYQIILCSTFNILFLLLVIPFQLILFYSISLMTKGADSSNSSTHNGKRWIEKKNIWMIIFISIFILLFNFPCWYSKPTLSLYTNPTPPLSLSKIIIDSLGFLIFIIIRIIIGFITKRTASGEELYQKTKKFREFLEITPKEGIETQFNDSRDCYFDIFSYCFALGMSNKCISEFNKFFNNNLFNVLYENKLINEKILNTQAPDTEKLQIYMTNLFVKENEYLINLLTFYDDEFLGKKVSLTDIQNIKYSGLMSQLYHALLEN